MITTATEAARAASRDTATAAQVKAASAAGRAAGREAARSGKRQPCPYALGTLTAHVWLRWYVHARATANGVPR